jgi:hypothetical protein
MAPLAWEDDNSVGNEFMETRDGQKIAIGNENENGMPVVS